MSSGAQPAFASLSQLTKRVIWILLFGAVGVLAFVLFTPSVAIIGSSVIAAIVTALIYTQLWFTTKKNGSTQPLAKDTSSYIQSCFTVMAIIVGAGWAAYIWKTQWDEHMPALQVNVRAHQAHPPEATEKEFFIAGNVNFKNAGTRRTKVWLADGPIFVAKVTSPSKLPLGTTDNLQAITQADCNAGKLTLDTPSRFWLSRPRADGRYDIEVETEIRPGEQDDFHFLVRVQDKGTYAVMFSSELSEEDEKESWPYSDRPTPCLSPIDKNNKPRPRWESAAFFVDVQ